MRFHDIVIEVLPDTALKDNEGDAAGDDDGTTAKSPPPHDEIMSNAANNSVRANNR